MKKGETKTLRIRALAPRPAVILNLAAGGPDYPGLRRNKHSGLVQNVVTLDDLFRDA